MKSEVVIAVYRPHPGKIEDLKSIVKDHVPTLRTLGLVTLRPEILAQSRDGTFLEIFEWKSAEASSQAHEHPVVAKIWEAMAQVCDFTSLDQLPESKKPFSHFTPVEP